MRGGDSWDIEGLEKKNKTVSTIQIWDNKDGFSVIVNKLAVTLQNLIKIYAI